MKNISIFQVDSFTNKPFFGNPAGVCILQAPVDADWMQKVAREMNLSETGFLHRKDEGFSLRWFTPDVEVDLCGHATLASAHILWEEGMLRDDENAVFHTKSGILTARKLEDWIELNFPTDPETEAALPEGLLDALGAEAEYVGKNSSDFLVEVASEEAVRALAPDFTLLKTIPARGIMVTSVSESKEYDFISRFFAPAVGVNEDPVTGSAHCCLGPYWMNRLGKKECTAYQASARGGVIKIRVEGDRALLKGQAVKVFHGYMDA